MRKSTVLTLAAAVAVFGAARTGGTTAPDDRKELGKVRWERHYECGVQRARSTGLPIFLFFQEVSGCATALRSLDLTPLQQTRVNAALASGSDPLHWLSPRQREEIGESFQPLTGGLSCERAARRPRWRIG